LLQVFRRNNISAFIALLFVAFVCKLRFLLHPELIVIDNTAFEALFFNMNRLKTLFTNHPTLYIFLSVIAQFIFAVYLNTVVIGQKLYAHKNYFTALAFILITSFLPQLNYFSGAFVANIFLLMGFSTVLQLSHASKPRQSCFNMGLWLALATFFHFPLIIMLVVFILFIWLLRPFMLQELVACLLGFITPFYFALALLYLTGNLKTALSRLNLHLQIPSKLVNELPVLIFGIVSGILLAYSVYLTGLHAGKNAMIVKKKWRLMHAFLLFAIISGVFSAVFPHTYLIVALTPFSILLSQSFHNRKEKMNIFTFFFLIISALCVQWIFLK
jgi:hypothetical protein